MFKVYRTVPVPDASPSGFRALLWHFCHNSNNNIIRCHILKEGAIRPPPRPNPFPIRCDLS